jgi:hypothetical protein
VDRVYGPVDRNTRSVHMDSRRRGAMGLPELQRMSDPSQGSLPRGVLEGGGTGVVLTEGGAGRWTAGGESAMVGNKWVMIELDGRAIRTRMERADVRNGKVVWRRCSREPFIGRGRREVSGRGRSGVH